MAFVTGTGETYDGTVARTLVINEADESIEFTPPGRRGDTAWIGWFWVKAGEGASILTLQFKPASTWRTLLTSDGVGAAALPAVTDSYMALSCVMYRFICLTADFVEGDSFTVEIV